LHRPWPDLKSTALPMMTIAALVAAVACCFSGGLLAILAQVVTAGLSIAYAMTGFAVLHTLTLAKKKPRAMAWLRLRRGRGLRLGPAGRRPAWAGRRRLRPTPPILAQPAAAAAKTLIRNTELFNRK